MKLSEFFAAFSTVHRERDGWVVHCPAHADGKPSLRVALNDDNDILLHCRAGCAKREVLRALPVPVSALFDVVVDDVDAVKIGAQASSGPTPAMVAQLKQYLRGAGLYVDPALEYASRRFGITTDTFKALGLGYDGGTIESPLRPAAYSRVPRLVVPFYDFQGVAKGVQGRALEADETRWCGFRNGDEGEAWARFGVFRAAEEPTEYAIITEGPGDALTAVAAGFDAVYIRGAALAGVAGEFTEGLAGQTIVVAGDNDAAGESFNAAVVEALGPDVVRLVPPDGLSDLSDWYADTSSGSFARELRKAILLAEAGAPPPTDPPPDPDPDPDPEEPTIYPFTQLGNAQRLRDRFGGDVRYTPEAGFMLFNGVTWGQDRFNAVRTAAQNMLVDEAEAAFERAQALRDAGDDDAAEMGLASYMVRSQSSHGIDAIIKELKALEGVACSLEDFDAHHTLLAFRNGVVDLRTGELVAGDNRELLITRQLEMDYDPQAECPQWLDFLTEVFPNHPEMPAYLQRLVGYGITGRTDAQCFVVLHGSGANGKSVFTETLSQVFEAVTNTTPFSTFEEKPSGGIPNDLAALKGARLVMASEGEAGKPMAEALLKRVTGHDLITARFMRQEFFTFRPTFLLMLATNHRPRFRGQDEGLWRRVKLIPWERYFTPDERDNTIWERLLSEAQGIARWAVQGAVEWFQHGLQDPESIVAATANYRATADALAGFFPGVLVHDPDHEELGNDVFTAYTEWCEEEHLPMKERWTRRAFYSALEERGVQRTSKRAGQVLVGVRISKPQDRLNPIKAVS